MANTYLVLEKHALSSNGLWDLTLTRYTFAGKKLGNLSVNSGQPWAQIFLKAGGGLPSNYAPLEEGEYLLGPLEWAGEAREYIASWGDGLGPLWVSIDPAPNNHTRRSALGFHLDANRDTSPGSAGCVVLKTLHDLKTFVGWFYDSQGAPSKLIVNWGFKTVSYGAVKPDNTEKLKVFFTEGKDPVVYLNDQKRAHTMFKVFVNDTAMGLVISNKQVRPVQVQALLLFRPE